MPDVAYVNGTFGPLADACVSVEDRGFQFADGVYEVLAAPGGTPFRLAEHLGRLRRSGEAIGLIVDSGAVDLAGAIREGIQRCGYDDVLVYVQVTRGVASRDHVIRAGLPPTIVMTFKPLPVYDEEQRRTGVKVETVREIRWERCSVKSIALLPNVLLKNAARQRGFYDAIIVGPDGHVREASAANVFIVAAGVVKTPPESEAILHGVTRAYVIECAKELDIPVETVEIGVDELRAADEVFLTSTTMGVMPVTEVDGRAVGSGEAGEITRRLWDAVDYL